MQVFWGRGHSNQWWGICCCYWKPTAGFDDHLLADPFPTDELCCKWYVLTCRATVSYKLNSEAQVKADTTGQLFRELHSTFPELSKVLSWVMCPFGSTYLCQKLFPTMNFIKCKYRPGYWCHIIKCYKVQMYSDCNCKRFALTVKNKIIVALLDLSRSAGFGEAIGKIFLGPQQSSGKPFYDSGRESRAWLTWTGGN